MNNGSFKDVIDLVTPYCSSPFVLEDVLNKFDDDEFYQEDIVSKKLFFNSLLSQLSELYLNLANALAASGDRKSAVTIIENILFYFHSQLDQENPIMDADLIFGCFFKLELNRANLFIYLDRHDESLITLNNMLSVLNENKSYEDYSFYTANALTARAEVFRLKGLFNEALNQLDFAEEASYEIKDDTYRYDSALRVAIKKATTIFDCSLNIKYFDFNAAEDLSDKYLHVCKCSTNSLYRKSQLLFIKAKFFLKKNKKKSVQYAQCAQELISSVLQENILVRELYDSVTVFIESAR